MGRSVTMASTRSCRIKQKANPMRTIADENIPYVEEAFGRLGEVVTLPGRKIDAASVRDAEILLVRSITKVDASLLERTHVRFVGTATIGTDHVDEEYLRSRGIAFASAPGSNANSVAEYVVAALLTLAGKKNLRLKGKTIGIIGVGNCGSRVVTKAEALGMRVLLNDPPLRRQTGDETFRPLEELFCADILTLHVPLTYEGMDATYHLADEVFLSKLRPECILINTSRGAVVDNQTLLAALNSGSIGGVVLDVWENEPSLDLQLLDRVDIGSSHIAGYSLDGKANATAMIYRAACEFLGVEAEWELTSALPKPYCARIEIGVHGERQGRKATLIRTESKSDEEITADAVRHVYDIEKDDAALRGLHRVEPAERGAFFDRLRKDYPVRREFHNTEVVLAKPESHLADVLSGLGFRVGKSGELKTNRISRSSVR